MSYALAQEKIAQAKAAGHTKLDLAGLKLEELPPELWELEQLEVLVLGKWDQEKREWLGNRLSSLPEAIVQLTNLQELYLWGNQLSSLPDAIGSLTNLTELDLGNNRLISLPDAIGSLTNLTALGLSENRLISLPEAIVSLTNLTSLSLSYNQLSSLPEAIVSLANLTQIHEVDKQNPKISLHLRSLH